MIKKNSELYRIADVGDQIDDRRKYVSILPGDRKAYRSIPDQLALNEPHNFHEYTYKAKRDLRVAHGEQVADYVLSKYGNEKLRRQYDELQYLYSVPVIKADKISNSSDREFVKSLKEEYYSISGVINDIFHTELFENHAASDEVFDHFKSLGYDAIVDVEDAGISDYPLILLNPKDSISQHGDPFRRPS